MERRLVLCFWSLSRARLGKFIEPLEGDPRLTLEVPRIVVPPEGYLAKVAALCKKHNVLLIGDEIQTVHLPGV